MRRDQEIMQMFRDMDLDTEEKRSKFSFSFSFEGDTNCNVLRTLRTETKTYRLNGEQDAELE